MAAPKPLPYSKPGRPKPATRPIAGAAKPSGGRRGIAAMGSFTSKTSGGTRAKPGRIAATPAPRQPRRLPVSRG